MKTGTRWAILVVSYNRIYQTRLIIGCLSYYVYMHMKILFFTYIAQACSIMYVATVEILYVIRHEKTGLM